jgi:flagellar basal-body rod modification protein FlgD
MAISPTAPAGSDLSSSATTETPLPMQTLGQNDFLKLLVTQLTSQDPLNPQKDTEFIAQMAQFSALEQSKAMQSDIAQLRTEQEFLQANSLLGRAVELQTGQDTSTTGTVSAVTVEAGTPKLVVNGQAYDLSQLLTIRPDPTLNAK